MARNLQPGMQIPEVFWAPFQIFAVTVFCRRNREMYEIMLGWLRIMYTVAPKPDLAFLGSPAMSNLDFGLHNSTHVLALSEKKYWVSWPSITSRVLWLFGKKRAENSYEMGPRKKFLNPQAWLGSTVAYLSTA